MELNELTAQRDALKQARYEGILTVRAGEKWVTYKTDKEMAAALAALERDIANLQKKRPPRRLLTYGLKGL